MKSEPRAGKTRAKILVKISNESMNGEKIAEIKSQRLQGAAGSKLCVQTGLGSI